MLDSPETALKTVENTRTKTGLRVTARILDKVYEIGRQCSDAFRDIKDRLALVIIPSKTKCVSWL
jgi:hypothetical protein